MRLLRTLVLLLVSSVASAQEFKPFPRANITEDQWNTYFNEVRMKLTSNVQDIEDQKLLVFTDAAGKTIYAFAKPGHPAHPAWIARKLEQRGDELWIGQIGYFSGAEPPFAQLFRAYIELNDKMRQDFKNRPQQVESK